MTRGSGRYHDGASAMRREVTLEFTRDGLRIADVEDEREIAFWRYPELRPVDEAPRAGRPLRIRTGRGPARIVLADPPLIAELARYAPRLAASESNRAALWLRWIGLMAASVAVLLAAIWFALPRFAEGAARFVPYEWETVFGRRLVEPVIMHLALFDRNDAPAVCTAGPGSEALEALAQRLAPDDSPYGFRVRVVNLEMNNAFALPGGQILITEGLLRFVESPDEVAGVLAHEMGHVIRRHATAAMIEGLGLAFLFGVLLGDFGAGAVGWAGEYLVGTTFRRKAEAEADSTALALLERAGLRSRGLVDFFQRLERESGGTPEHLHLLSTHPGNESRRRRFASGATASAPSLGETDWRSLREICEEQEPLVLTGPENGIKSGPRRELGRRV